MAFVAGRQESARPSSCCLWEDRATEGTLSPPRTALHEPATQSRNCLLLTKGHAPGLLWAAPCPPSLAECRAQGAARRSREGPEVLPSSVGHRGHVRREQGQRRCALPPDCMANVLSRCVQQGRAQRGCLVQTALLTGEGWERSTRPVFAQAVWTGCSRHPTCEGKVMQATWGGAPAALRPGREKQCPPAGRLLLLQDGRANSDSHAAFRRPSGMKSLWGLRGEGGEGSCPKEPMAQTGQKHDEWGSSEAAGGGQERMEQQLGSWCLEEGCSMNQSHCGTAGDLQSHHGSVPISSHRTLG